MAPTQAVLLSPAELSYIQTSLSLSPPIRTDGRTPTQFRPLVAETDILPTTNGSARVCFSDGTEAIVGVKAQVEKTSGAPPVGGETEQEGSRGLGTGGEDVDMGDADRGDAAGMGQDSWLEVSVEIPGFRDDDQLPVFLSSMLSEALLADGTLRDRLYINSRFHWVLYVDILLLSAPLSYPLPLLSLTTYLAMLQTKFPALISEKDEDPLFNDDWDAAVSLYDPKSTSKPPITLLVMTVKDNILFDPTQEELAVADGLVAISVTERNAEANERGALAVVAMRSIDPPSRSTNPGIPNSMNPATGGVLPTSREEAHVMRESADPTKVWRLPRGGFKRAMLAPMINAVVKKDGVGWEVLDALNAVER